MKYFPYKNGELHCEDVPVPYLAEQSGTPVYIYSRQAYLEQFSALREAFTLPGTLICYSVKANTNPAILSDILDEGGGFDVVSGGELSVTLEAGADPRKIFFSGVGKTDEELRQAIDADILAVNVESAKELEVLEKLAKEMDAYPGVCLRVNPDVDPETHRYITTGKKENKFGTDPKTALEMGREAIRSDHLRLRGLHSHIGSQITELEPYRNAVSRNVELISELRDAGGEPHLLNMGGGFGIRYRDEEVREPGEFADAIHPYLEGEDLDLVLEPGRFIVGNAGVLVSRVLYRKPSAERTFVVCDAGMNHMIRPSLYEAYHRIWPVSDSQVESGEVPSEDAWQGATELTNVVGPICETSDFFCEERALPPMERGDLLSVFSAGAYGYSMSSHYNLHPRPVEMLVDGDRYRTISRRETVSEFTDQYVREESWEMYEDR